MTARIKTLSWLSPRDQRILALTSELVTKPDLAEMLRAMKEAVERIIPAGRVYHLGSTPHAPIFGSIISGIGITEGPEGIVLVRVLPPGERSLLGRF